MKKAVAQLTQSLLLSLAARSQLQELREKLRSPAVDKGPILKAKPPASQKDILGVCCDPLVLAQQLTHIELVSARGRSGGWVGGSCGSRATSPPASSVSAPRGSPLGRRGSGEAHPSDHRLWLTVRLAAASPVPGIQAPGHSSPELRGGGGWPGLEWPQDGGEGL